MSPRWLIAAIDLCVCTILLVIVIFPYYVNSMKLKICLIKTMTPSIIVKLISLCFIMLCVNK